MSKSYSHGKSTNVSSESQSLLNTLSASVDQFSSYFTTDASPHASLPETPSTLATKANKPPRWDSRLSNFVSVNNGEIDGEINSDLANLYAECKTFLYTPKAGVTFYRHFPDDPEFNDVVEAVEEAITRGVLPDLIAAGSSGSYFVKDKDGKIVAVFKPKNEEPYGPANPKWKKRVQRTLCPCCFGRGCLISNHGYLSEAGASIVDEYLGLQIVPKTKIVFLVAENFNYSRQERKFAKRYYERNESNTTKSTRKTSKISVRGPIEKKIDKILKARQLPPKIGSFQLFVRNCMGGADFLAKIAKRPMTAKATYEFQLLFERLVVLDYIIRNTDRNPDNWLVLHDAAEDADVIKLAAIDNGLAFPHKHPDSVRAYPFHWATMPQARTPFSQNTKKIVMQLDSQDFLHGLVRKLGLLFSIDKAFKASRFEHQMSVMRGQIHNLISAVKDGLSPAELAELPHVTLRQTIKFNTGMMDDIAIQDVDGIHLQKKHPCFKRC